LYDALHSQKVADKGSYSWSWTASGGGKEVKSVNTNTLKAKESNEPHI